MGDCNCQKQPKRLPLYRYYFNVQTYTVNTVPELDPLTNGIDVRNTGNTLVSFNGCTLQPGESKSVGGNLGEILDMRIQFIFSLPVPAPPIPANAVELTLKNYYEFPDCS